MRGDARTERLVEGIVAVALTVVVLGPALVHRGYVLRGDMVFVPDQPWKPAWLGLDGSVPRSVPMDAVVWLLGQVLPGDIVQKLLLAGTLVALAIGVSRLLAGVGLWGRLAGMTLACWNPYVAERLGIGQWACVAGLAVLPWLVQSCVRLRDGEGGGPTTAVLLVISAVCAPSMGLVAAFVALCVLLGRPRRAVLVATGAMAVVANLPWLVPSLLRSPIHPDPGQFAGFAAVAESGAGVLASVLSGGGIWKTSIVPVERGYAAVVIVSAVIAVASAGALVRSRRTVRGSAGLAVAAGCAVLLAWLSSWDPVLTALAHATARVPALGIVRDSTRYLAPVVLAVAVGFGLLVDGAVVWIRSRGGAATPVGLVLALVPVFLLPTLAWGIQGFLSPSTYPDSWSATASALGRARDSAGARGGATVVLPWHGSYRGFAWTSRHAVLDPAPRFLPGAVLTDDRLFLANRVLAGEDPYLARVGSALAAPDPSARLRSLGVRWVLVERAAGGAVPKTLRGRAVIDTGGLVLLDLGAVRADARDVRNIPAQAPVVAADLLVAALVIGESFIMGRKSR